MKRALMLAAAIGFVLPATAHAGAFRGVVIAKNAKRHALVTAAANGTVRTVRTPKGFRRIGLGARVAVRGTKLPDGTFTARTTKRLGRAKKAHVRATVVKRAGKKLYLSAGNSVFVFGLRGGAGSELHPGDRVDASARVGRARLFCDDVTPIGHEDRVELEGIYLSTDAGALSLAVHGHGLVKVIVPDDVDLPDLSPGDEVSLVATVEADGSFTLVSLDDEDASDDTGDEGDGGDGSDSGDGLDVAGKISALGPNSVSVTVPPAPTVASVQHEGKTATCALQAGEDLRGFAVGDDVEMTCALNDEGHYLLTGLASDSASVTYDGDTLSEWFDLTGALASIRSDGVGIKVDGHAEQVNCAMPAGTDLSGFALGDTVEMQCNYDDGRFELAELSSNTADVTL